MNYADDLRSLCKAASEISHQLADLRDKYLSLGGMHERFSDLASVYSNLQIVGDVVFALSELKPGVKIEREFVMLAHAFVDNAKILYRIASNEYDLRKPN